MWYLVRPGDHLSGVLSTLNQCPLYGKNGSVQKAISMNPHAITSAGDWIRPGIRIFLPFETLKIAANSTNITINSYGRVQYKSENLLNCKSVHPSSQVSISEKTTLAPASKPAVKQKHTTIPIKHHSKRKPAAQTETAPAPSPLEAHVEPTVGSRISFTPGYQFVSIVARDNSTGGKATILSDNAYAIGLNWTQNWGDGLETWLAFREVFAGFQEPAGRTFNQAHQSFSFFQLGVRSNLTSSLQLGAFAGVEQEGSLLAVTTSLLTFQKFSVPKLGLSLGVRFFERGKLSILGEAMTTYHFSAESSSATFSGGLGEYGGKIKIRQGSKTFALTGGIFYRTEDLKSTLINVRRSDLGMEVGLEFDFGD